MDGKRVQAGLSQRMADKEARARGYPDAATEQAFYAQRAAQLRKPQDYVQGMETEKQVKDSTMWHPRELIGHVAHKIAEALGR